VGGGERAVLQASPRPAPAEPLGLESVLRSDGRPDAAWPLALVALLAAACLAQHRSRRLVMSVLVVLVAVSGVEAAVHSVHHASDGGPVACPTASFAAHVDGTTAAALALDTPVHLVGAVAAPSGPSLASLRSLDPSQPRAPPAPLV